MKLSIISPCYNESQNIKKFVTTVFSSLKKYKIELIIVDDDSTDGTDKVLLNLRKKFKNLLFIKRIDKPRDLTQSCFLGIQKAKFKTIVIMDSDLQHQPNDVIKLYKKLKETNSDIVVGTRNLIKRNKGLNMIRQFASILLIFSLNLILKKKTSDPMSGFFIFKKKIYQKQNNYFGKGFKILIDLIYSSKKNLKIADTNINFKLRKKNESKINYKILSYIIYFILKNSLKRILK